MGDGLSMQKYTFVLTLEFPYRETKRVCITPDQIIGYNMARTMGSCEYLRRYTLGSDGSHEEGCFDNYYRSTALQYSRRSNINSNCPLYISSAVQFAFRSYLYACMLYMHIYKNTAKIKF